MCKLNDFQQNTEHDFLYLFIYLFFTILTYCLTPSLEPAPSLDVLCCIKHLHNYDMEPLYGHKRIGSRDTCPKTLMVAVRGDVSALFLFFFFSEKCLTLQSISQPLPDRKQISRPGKRRGNDKWRKGTDAQLQINASRSSVYCCRCWGFVKERLAMITEADQTGLTCCKCMCECVCENWVTDI